MVAQAPPVSYFSISEVYPPKLKTEDKREHLTPARVDAYNYAIANSAVLSPDGPFHLIDIHSLTRGALPSCTAPACPAWCSGVSMLLATLFMHPMGCKHLACSRHAYKAVKNMGRCAECGPECTHDGLHYSNMTYDTAVQVWANTLRSLL